jgi:hypothetical protein
MSYFYNWAYFLGIKHCLVVLGGVTVFIGVPDNVGPVAQVVKLYFEMFFSSFQVKGQAYSYRGMGLRGFFLYRKKKT